MNEQQCLEKMVAPGTPRPGKYRSGVIQIHVTRSCDKACFNCTQGSNLGGRATFISLEHFEGAIVSLKSYFGVVGVFGGNPAIHPRFSELCEILRKHIPYEQRGLWCNNPLGKGRAMRETFNPAVSNLNVHLDQEAYNEFKRDWPECHPVGLTTDSRHSPPYVAMKDVLKKECPKCQGRGKYPFTSDFVGYGMANPPPKLGTLTLEHNCLECGGNEWAPGSGQVYDESRAWELISNCDINKHWSAMIGVFRGQLRAWFCEIAGAQSILHQDDPDYPDTGVPLWLPVSTENIHGESKLIGGLELPWWRLDMGAFREQVKKHCHECGVPLRGYGELAQAKDGVEQVSETHKGIYKPKRFGRKVELVTVESQLGRRLERMTHYLQNSKE